MAKKEKSTPEIRKEEDKKANDTFVKNKVRQSSDENMKCVSGEDARKYPSLKNKKGNFIKVGAYRKIVANDIAESKTAKEKSEKKAKKESKKKVEK